MQTAENCNDSSGQTRRRADLDKLCIILYCFTFFLLLLLSSVLLKFPLLLCAVFSGFCLAPQSFRTSALLFLACLFFSSPCRHFCCPCQLCRLVHCCNKSATPFISCHRCYKELEMCALPSPLSPLTATSPLYHWRADQIGTGPSHSVLDKWKVAMSENL